MKGVEKKNYINKLGYIKFISDSPFVLDVKKLLQYARNVLYFVLFHFL
jgi:hypothetical protein